MTRLRLIALPFSMCLAAAAIAQTAATPAVPPAAASAPATPPIEFKTVAQALTELKARDGNGTVVATTEDGWVIINEPLAAAQWSFTPKQHPAYPAVVRRIIKRGGGAAVSVQTASVCEASTEACAQLLRDFDALNERITQAVRARGRPEPKMP
jgi:hypothetical protein